jgi:hypothetical protein
LDDTYLHAERDLVWDSTSASVATQA